MRVFLVREERLAPVLRRGGPRLQDALDLLAAGPTAREVSEGFDTAGSAAADRNPERAAARARADRGHDELVSLSGQQQLVAAAELVWTATEVPGIDRVLVELDGRPIELPTDTGLSGEPVRRVYYRSLAPAQ